MAIIAFGASYGINSISSGIEHVVEASIPTLKSGFSQMISLQEANQALYSALSQERVEELNKQRKVFETRIKTFNEKLEQLTPQVENNNELSQLLTSSALLSAQSIELRIPVRQNANSGSYIPIISWRNATISSSVI